ncbi:MAG: NepR family anti-sigma factor [Phenylobacterium sp.]|uniref:NepR family anti-sigma factor n=1 Tax=Phenylobacterium sp. TaxID=1871053 RepID=UPI00391A1E6B
MAGERASRDKSRDKAIDEALREMYRAVEQRPLPDRLRSLVEQLDGEGRPAAKTARRRG